MVFGEYGPNGGKAARFSDYILPFFCAYLLGFCVLAR